METIVIVVVACVGALLLAALITTIISLVDVAKRIGVKKDETADTPQPQEMPEIEATDNDAAPVTEEARENEVATETAETEVATEAEETEETCENEVAAENEPTSVSTDEPQAENKPETDVNFSTDKLTLEQKYLKLSPEYRAYYDEIIRYAMAIDGHKRYKNIAYEEYKVGKNRIVKIKIKNGVITCELLVPNLDFKNYVSDNKIDVRQSATVIRVTDKASLSAVKGSMDIVLKEIEKEREYKKEKALERRRQRRAMAKFASTNDKTENDTPSENGKKE